MIDEKKFGTVGEAAKMCSVNRRTLADAVVRQDTPLEITATAGGTSLVSLASVRRWKKNADRRPGPKAKAV